MMNQMEKNFSFFILFLFLFGCASTGADGEKVSAECRKAHGAAQICIGLCLLSGKNISDCGWHCEKETLAKVRACGL